MRNKLVRLARGSPMAIVGAQYEIPCRLHLGEANYYTRTENVGIEPKRSADAMHLGNNMQAVMTGRPRSWCRPWTMLDSHTFSVQQAQIKNEALQNPEPYRQWTGFDAPSAAGHEGDTY